MSAGEALLARCVRQLADAPALAAVGVFDLPPARVSPPYAIVEDPVLQAWDGAGVTGRVGTLAVQVRDAGEQPARLRQISDAIEAALAALPADIGAGWRLAGLALARSRVTRTRDGWVGRTEWAVRLFRAN